MKILVTGAAGFIGFHTCLKLLDLGHEVYAIDNINDYYEVNLKYDRLKELGLTKAHVSIFNNEVSSEKYRSLRFSKIDISDYESLKKLFEKENFEVDRTDTFLTSLKEKAKKINIVFTRASPIMEVLTGIMIALLIYYSGKLILKDEIFFLSVNVILPVSSNPCTCW